MYCRVASGTNTTKMIAIQMSVYMTGCCKGQPCGGGAAGLVLPNSSRAACVTVETGFHSAIVRSTVGKFSGGTNVFATKVIGKITMNEALFTTSGAGTNNPTYAITHENA